MRSPTKFWLAVGIPQNWYTAFDYGLIWGLKANQRHYWEAITENTDIVFFYVTSPISGVIGYGRVLEKLHQTSPLWPEERARNEVIWPLRFFFDILGALPPDAWKTQHVTSEALKIRARAGFQTLEQDLAQELVRALPGEVPKDLALVQPVGAVASPRPTALETPSEMRDPHAHIQHLLAEIGRLQKFIAEREFPIETRRLDVVWRRVQRSVPSFVFEVQVSGNLTEGMGKLKQAFELWNSSIFLVGKAEHRRQVNELLSATFREIQRRFRFLELDQVKELHQRKRAYCDLENQLGILG